MTEPNTPRSSRNAAATKARILEAAMACFSEGGYANSGIREISARAGVSYNLVGRYYGSKAGLLEAALDATIHTERLLVADRASFGVNLAALLLESIERPSLAAMTVLAGLDPLARTLVARVVDTRIIAPMAQWIGGPEGRERAVAITMLGSGFIAHTRMIPLLGETAGLTLDHPTVRMLAEAIQAIVDG